MTDDPPFTVTRAAALAAQGPATVLTLRGRLDHQTAGVLREAVDAALSDRPACAALVIDLDGVEFMASAGLRTLLYARRVAEAAGVRLTLAGSSAQVGAVFEVSRFADLFRRSAGVAEALTAGDPADGDGPA